MPGSFLPSRSSSDAPPPVEICEILAAMSSPASCTAAAESPPPMTVNAGLSEMAFATPNVPCENGSFSNMPSGPFHRMVLAFSNFLANSSTLRGPTSSAMVPAGILSAS